MGLWDTIKKWLGISRSPGAATKDAGDDEKPLISLVLLLREPRYLDQVVLTGIVNRAWGADLSSDNPDATEFVVGESPLFIIQYQGRQFLVNNFSHPYVEDVDAAAQNIKELRLRKAFLEHRAWLSVDLLGESGGQEELQHIYGLIGRLTAALADTDCAALFSPATEQMIPYDPAVEEKLRGPDALEVFSSLGEVPVMEASGDDPRMKAAVAEANRRWPEFAAAFQQRRPDQNFAVKFPFEDGEHLEFMWVTVTGIDGDTVSGRVDNEPVDVRTVRLGSRVRIPRQRLNDWIFTDGEEMHGGFTIKVIQEMQGEG